MLTGHSVLQIQAFTCGEIQAAAADGGREAPKSGQDGDPLWNSPTLV